MKFIDDFIDCYNSYLEKKKERFNDVELITRKPLVNDFVLGNKHLEYFFNKFLFPKKYNYPGFCFLEEPWVNDSHAGIAFHADYNMMYQLSLTSGEVLLIDIDDESEVWLCSKDINIFFSCMSVVLELKLESLSSPEFEAPTYSLNAAFKTCMERNENDLECARFYEHIIGL